MSDDIARECERLVLRFAVYGDSGEHDRLAGLFVEDGVFIRPSDPEHPIVGRAAILDSFRRRPRDRVTRHFCANFLITEQGPQTASGISYVLLFAGNAADGRVSRQLVGEYRDRFVRTEDGWRFSRREGSISLTA